MKCKFRVRCLVKNVSLPRTSYHLRKGQKTTSESRKTFLQHTCDFSSLGLSFKEFCSSEGLKPDPEVKGRKYCPLPLSMGRMGDFSILAP